MVKHAKATAKALGVDTELYQLPVEEQLNFLRTQVQESKKIIYRHLVELNTADAMEEFAATIKDDQRKTAFLNVVANRRTEGKANIEQVKVNLDACYDLYLETGGNADDIDGQTEDWRR